MLAIRSFPTECSICAGSRVTKLRSERSRAESEIERNVNSIYCGAIIDKHKDAYPIWAFIEIVPFGQLLSFYRFCADRYKNKKMQNTWYQLMACKEIRNASAHSNCVLNDLTPNSAEYNTSNDVMRSLSTIKGISKIHVSRR